MMRHRPTESATRVDLPDLLAMRLRAARLAQPRLRVAGGHAATHSSRFRGRGVDYVESRAYQPGDDIRQMDWRVTARTGRPHTKLFEEEREQNILLIVDGNPSMHFGTRVRFKSVQAARTAALLAWIAVSGGDRIGALGFGPGLNAEVRPGGGPRGALRVLRALVEWDEATRDGGPVVALSEALQYARRVARPGTRVILLSDGFCSDADARRPLALLAEHCDLAAIVFTDPLEMAPPPPARYSLQSETGRALLDFAAARTRASWPRWFQERRAAMVDLFASRAIRWTMLDTPAEPDAALSRLIGFGRRRRVAGGRTA